MARPIRMSLQQALRAPRLRAQAPEPARHLLLRGALPVREAVPAQEVVPVRERVRADPPRAEARAALQARRAEAARPVARPQAIRLQLRRRLQPWRRK